MGGMKLSEEANVVFSTDYEGGNEMKISILDSRRSDLFSVSQPLDEESGLFLGEGRRNA